MAGSLLLVTADSGGLPPGVIATAGAGAAPQQLITSTVMREGCCKLHLGS